MNIIYSENRSCYLSPPKTNLYMELQITYTREGNQLESIKESIKAAWLHPSNRKINFQLNQHGYFYPIDVTLSYLLSFNINQILHKINRI